MRYDQEQLYSRGPDAGPQQALHVSECRRPDQNFLQIFDFALISGDKKTALKEPNSIVINEELAMRLFGTVQVLGKSCNGATWIIPIRSQVF